MKTSFLHRAHAGQMLAGLLRPFAHRPDALVLALPRGGVPVAFEVACRLALPLDVLIVRKLGLPGHEEYAMGAIAAGGVVIRQGDVAERYGISERAFAHVVEREQAELERREELYRRHRPPLQLRGLTVLLIDDGIATGATMHAAVRAVRRLGAARIIVATPVASEPALRELRGLADDACAVLVPAQLFAIGEFYQDFRQTSDEEVVSLLNTRATEFPAASAKAHRVRAT